MKRVQSVAVVAMIAAAGIMSGCSWVQRGAAAGGALGAVAGGVAGHNAGHLTVGQGAVIGAGAGAATGGLAGEAFATKTDSDIEREIENLRAQLEAAETELAAVRASGMTPDKAAELADLKVRLDETLAQLDASHAELAQVRSALESARSDVASADARMKDRDASLANIQADLAMARSQAANERDRAAELKAQLDEARDARLAADKTISELNRELDSAQKQLAAARSQLDTVQVTLKEKQAAVDQLRSELEDLNIEFEETSRGLTLTIVDELLFNIGSADVSPEGAALLGEVANLIQTNFPNRELMIEGHTDNQPIVHSGWYSNWELGAARALSVLHEMVTEHNFDPAMLSATTYGEFRPQAPNATTDGRSQNRRSVIVILPEKMPLTRNQMAGL